MEILCQALSSQIIEQCKKHIKLDIVLGNNPEMGIQMLKKCIFCCNIYKTIYENVCFPLNIVFLCINSLLVIYSTFFADCNKCNILY